MNNNLKLLLGVLVLLLSYGLYYYVGQDTFFVLIGVISGYLAIAFLWGKLYCRGRSTEDGGVEFNLSKVGESMMIFYYIGISALTIYSLIEAFPVWYYWILPVIVSVLSFLRAHEIFANSNDRILIHNGEVRWWNNAKVNSIKPSAFTFEMKRTNCISMNLYSSNVGWHLRLTDKDGKTKSIDLKMLNLNGHKMAIEQQLKIVISGRSH